MGRLNYFLGFALMLAIALWMEQPKADEWDQLDHLPSEEKELILTCAVRRMSDYYLTAPVEDLEHVDRKMLRNISINFCIEAFNATRPNRTSQ